MLKNWVYYMQRGLQSMWSKKPKTNKKYAIDLNDRTREKKINEKWTENALDLGRISAFGKVNKRNKEEEYPYNIEFGDGRTKEEMDKMQKELMEKD